MANKWIPNDPFSHVALHEWESALELGSSMERRYQAVQAVFALSVSPRREASLVQALQDEDPTVRALAARLLGKLASRGELAGDVAANAGARLNQLLNDADPDVQFESARTLISLLQTSGNIPSNELAVDTLARLVSQPGASPSVIASGIESLSNAVANHPQLVTTILPFSTDSHGEVREAVALALSRLNAGWEQVIPAAVELLDDEEPLAREYAAQALGKSGISTHEVITALQRATADEDHVCAETARQALAQIQAQ